MVVVRLVDVGFPMFVMFLGNALNIYVEWCPVFVCFRMVDYLTAGGT